MTTAMSSKSRLAAALAAYERQADPDYVDEAMAEGVLAADPTLAADLALAAAIRATAADGKVDAPMYFTDATYHAIVYRIFRGTPPNEALREAAKEASE